MKKKKQAPLVNKLSVKSITQNIKEKQEQKRQLEEIKQKQEELIQSGYYKKDGQVIVSSVNGLQKWLEMIGDNVTGSSLEIIKTQLQVISVVSSPIMVGMTMDRMIDSLNKSLKFADSESDKMAIRDTYASMIQNLFFFLEAKLRYAIDKNKEEAFQLLDQAGNALAECARAIAKRVSNERGSQSDIPLFKDLIGSAPNKVDFFKRMTLWAKDRVEIKKRLDDYQNTVEDTFRMFDTYSEMIGPSILINGMLSKYRQFLVAVREEELLAPMRQINTRKNVGKGLNILGKTLENDTDMVLVSPTAGALKFKVGALKVGGKMAQSVGSAMMEDNDKSISAMKIAFTKLDYFKSEIERLEDELQSNICGLRKLQNKFNKIEGDQNGLSETEQMELDNIRGAIESCKAEMADMNNKKKEFEFNNMEAAAIKRKVDEYDDELKQIEMKYIVR